MGAPLVPPPGWEELGDRPFSFYPAILNIAHNEWRYISATWSEVQVRNTKTGEDIWMPRAYLGAISQVDEPAIIVGLRKEVEWRSGAIVPHVRRVLEMPRAVNGPLPLNQSPEPAPVVSIRLESPAERR